MPPKGWIGKWAFEDNALRADADGRAAMQDGYIVAAKIDTGAITVDKLEANLLKYLIEVARVDSAHVDYCRVA